ncbi:MAG TPA: sugar phosphate isomerase/epimerase family protein [Verrucomicrobiae bacterium]|nr:sugar phosphate isomerase/epimerase family protein [Verrucomicrobiae bacterium]
MNLSFGYNTNGFGQHKLEDALEIIADCGYRGVALTLDNYHCNPFSVEPADLNRLRQLLDKLQLRVVIETGARYLLNPQRGRYPTLVSSEGRQIRLEFLRRAVDIAADLHAECVSFWSGAPEAEVPEHQAWDWLVTGCLQLAEHSKRRGVQLAFEPEPCMLVDDMAKFEVLKKHITSARFGLTMDIGHVFCTETAPFRQVYGKFANLIRNIHIEDIRDRKHEHLMFGEGELDFVAILRVLNDNKYTGLINVELPRHAHCAAETARASLEFLNAMGAKIPGATAAAAAAKSAPSAAH